MHPQLVDHVSKPLALLLIKIKDDRCIPRDWKMVWVSPIFKNGARNKAENYSSASFSSLVCKLMKSFVKESLMIDTRAGNPLSTKQ